MATDDQIRLLLVEDVPQVSAYVRNLLQHQKQVRLLDTVTDGRMVMDQVRELAHEHRPKLIVAGTTSYPRRLDPEPFKVVADEVGALLMFDIAHLAGLVAGGAHPNPVPFSVVVRLSLV